jgi:tRNA A58 N-methylase Trm61
LNSTTTLSMTDGTAIVVPNSVDLITPYVLREQADWFEDEIGFLRRLLLPGDQLIDIGANYGVYALSLARAVGPGGRVWAFEPASSTAGLLVESVRANGFAQLVVDQRAVSSAPGKARLALNANSELNSLARDGVPSGSSTGPTSWRRRVT